MGTLSARLRTLVLLRLAAHVLFVGLLAFGLAVSLADGTAPAAVAPVAVAVFGWYLCGPLLAGRHKNPSGGQRRLAWLWLLVLAAGWAGLFVLSAAFGWLGFGLLLLLLDRRNRRRTCCAGDRWRSLVR